MTVIKTSELPARTVSRITNMAGKIWDAGLVDRIGRFDASDYSRRMLTAAASTVLQVGANHDDDTEGTGEYYCEIQELWLGWSPTYEDALPQDARDELDSDVTCFLHSAWPYLSVDGISPEDAGVDFELSRNGAGSGFWDAGYKHGNALHEIAQHAGPFGLQVTGHGDESDGCNVCGEAIERLIGPVEDISDEWIHADRSITGHKPSGPIRVYQHYNG